MFAVSIVLILIATLAPSYGDHTFIYIDKVAHFLLFLFLSVNICYKYPVGNKRVEFLMLAILFGLITEVLQQFVPGRDMNIYDGVADTVGVLIGHYLYQKNQIMFDKFILKLGA